MTATACGRPPRSRSPRSAQSSSRSRTRSSSRPRRAGGYAKEMSKEYRAKQAALTAEHIAKQDIVITTALIPGRPAPRLIDAAMVCVDASRVGDRRSCRRARRQRGRRQGGRGRDLRERGQDRRPSQRARPRRSFRLAALRQEPARLPRHAGRQVQQAGRGQPRGRTGEGDAAHRTAARSCTPPSSRPNPRTSRRRYKPRPLVAEAAPNPRPRGQVCFHRNPRGPRDGQDGSSAGTRPARPGDRCRARGAGRRG